MDVPTGHVTRLPKAKSPVRLRYRPQHHVPRKTSQSLVFCNLTPELKKTSHHIGGRGQCSFSKDGIDHSNTLKPQSSPIEIQGVQLLVEVRQEGFTEFPDSSVVMRLEQ